MVLIKVKGKGFFGDMQWRLRGGVEVQHYMCSVAGLYGAGWSAAHPGHFTPVETHYPLYMRLGGAIAGVDGCGEEKISHMEFH